MKKRHFKLAEKVLWWSTACCLAFALLTNLDVPPWLFWIIVLGFYVTAVSFFLSALLLASLGATLTYFACTGRTLPKGLLE